MNAPPNTFIGTFGSRSHPALFLYEDDEDDAMPLSTFASVVDAKRCAAMIERGTDPEDAADECGGLYV